MRSVSWGQLEETGGGRREEEDEEEGVVYVSGNRWQSTLTPCSASCVLLVCVSELARECHLDNLASHALCVYPCPFECSCIFVCVCVSVPADCAKSL